MQGIKGVGEGPVVKGGGAAVVAGAVVDGAVVVAGAEVELQ